MDEHLFLYRRIKMNFQQIKGFAFDLDGVITDTAVFHAKAWQKLCHELGIQWTSTMASGTKGISRMDSLNLILEEAGRQNEFTEAEKQKMANDKNEYYKQFIQTLTPDDLLPGIYEFLNELRQSHYHIALASASHNAPVILERLEITSFFDTIVDPANLNKGKPAPDIYLAAAHQMDLNPKEVIGVEDAAAGVKAIHSAKEVAIGVNNEELQSMADIYFSSTACLTLDHIRNSSYFMD